MMGVRHDWSAWNQMMGWDGMGWINGKLKMGDGTAATK